MLYIPHIYNIQPRSILPAGCPLTLNLKLICQIHSKSELSQRGHGNMLLRLHSSLCLQHLQSSRLYFPAAFNKTLQSNIFWDEKRFDFAAKKWSHYWSNGVLEFGKKMMDNSVLTDTNLSDNICENYTAWIVCYTIKTATRLHIFTDI